MVFLRIRRALDSVSPVAVPTVSSVAVPAVSRVAAAAVGSRGLPVAVVDVVFLPFGVDGVWDEVVVVVRLLQRLLGWGGCLGRGVGVGGWVGNLLSVYLTRVDDDGRDRHLDDIDEVVLGRAGGQGN